ncbi:MAG TPA: pitrilysin family protein [Blastocatellia bacterium]|nr:pitrilysin family protein [Blastocatellia bacterium]
MYRKENRLSSFLVALVICTLTSAPVINAQSGRGRRNNPPPPPKPAEKQPPNPYKPTVLNVPEGGQIKKRDGDNITSRFELRNGLTIIIRERPSTGLAAMTTYVKTGFLDEPDENAGLSNLMAHLLLRGTATRPAATMAAELQKLGGTFSADAAYDRISFEATVPAESLGKLLEIEADLLQNPNLDPEEIRREAQFVIQALRTRQDDAMAYAMERMYATAFTAHRIRRGSAGSEDFLKNVTREQVQAFYQNHFQPKNTVLVLDGDLITAQVIGRIQQLYGNFGWPEKAAAPTPSAPTRATAQNSQPQAAQTSQPQSAQAQPASGLEEPPQDKLRYGNERADISHTIVTIGYHAPALSKTAEGLKEQAAMEVLSAVLGLGRGSRLVQALRERKGVEKEAILATDISTQYLPLPGVGIFSVQLRVDPDRIDRAEAEYFREIERFRRELLSEGELQRARSMLELRHIKAVTADSDEAGWLAHYQAQYGDYRLTDSYVSRIRAVTAKDVQEAAAKYLTLGNTTLHEYEPRNAQARTFTPEKFAELISVFASSLAQPVRPEEVKPAVALRKVAQGPERGAGDDNVTVAEVPLPIKDFSVFRGPRAYVREDHSRRKLTVGIFFQGGRLIEDQTSSGTTEMMLRCLLKSTTTRKADLIAHEMESYGGEIQIVNEPDFFGYTLDVLSRNSENAVRLLLDILENPFFDKGEIAREQNALLAQQVQQRDDSPQRALELLQASLYPNHPYGLPRYGLPAVIKSMSEEKLENWHNRTIKRQYPLVVLVGDTDGSALVASIFTEGFKRSSSNLDQTLKVSLPGAATPQEMIEQRSRRMTTQDIGFRTPDGKSNDHYALAILQSLASGPGGKLTVEVRDKQMLADRVTLSDQPQLASGLLFVSVATLPENEQRARDALRAELEKLAAAPSDEDFERGRNAAIGAYAVALQAAPVRLLEYARAIIFGRKPSDVETQPDLIRAVKKDDLKRVAETVIKPAQSGRGVVRGGQP